MSVDVTGNPNRRLYAFSDADNVHVDVGGNLVVSQREGVSLLTRAIFRSGEWCMVEVSRNSVRK